MGLAILVLLFFIGINGIILVAIMSERKKIERRYKDCLTLLFKYSISRGNNNNSNNGRRLF